MDGKRKRGEEEKDDDLSDLSPPKKIRHESSSNESFPMLETVMKSVVKVFTNYTQPNFSSPWQMSRGSNATASGFVIKTKEGKNGILTNAHAVAFWTAVRVRKHGESAKWQAKVLHVAHEADLALLTVEESEFWQGLAPLELGDIPNLRDPVLCVGYPTGGDEISITQGVVSRVSVGRYSHAEEDLLSVQIDAAINSGNSGGPAIENGGRVIGVAFETLNQAENIGYIIPTPVITHFLEDIAKNNRYSGLCELDIVYQNTDNTSMRSALGLPEKTNTGVLVCQVRPLSDTAKHVKAGDVLLAVENCPVASDGSISFRNNERVAFNHLVTSKFVGDSISLSLLRESKQVQCSVKLARKTALVRSHMYDTQPSYFIYGGLVFTALSVPYLRSEYGAKWDRKAPVRLCDKAFYHWKTRPDQEVVILNQVLVSAPTNIGYEDCNNNEVVSVNDVPVYSLKQLAQLIRSSTTDFLRFQLDNGQPFTVILGRKAAESTHADILKQNNIPLPGYSADLHEALNGNSSGKSNNDTSTESKNGGV